jgi:hypothetical protein
MATRVMHGIKVFEQFLKMTTKGTFLWSLDETGGLWGSVVKVKVYGRRTKSDYISSPCHFVTGELKIHNSRNNLHIIIYAIKDQFCRIYHHISTELLTKLCYICIFWPMFGNFRGFEMPFVTCYFTFSVHLTIFYCLIHLKRFPV